MSIDPAAPSPATPEQRTGQSMADLARRLRDLERGNATVTSGAGAPGAGVTSRFYVDETNLFLYVRVAGTYRRTGALV